MQEVQREDLFVERRRWTEQQKNVYHYEIIAKSSYGSSFITTGTTHSLRQRLG